MKIYFVVECIEDCGIDPYYTIEAAKEKLRKLKDFFGRDCRYKIFSAELKEEEN